MQYCRISKWLYINVANLFLLKFVLNDADYEQKLNNTYYFVAVRINTILSNKFSLKLSQINEDNDHFSLVSFTNIEIKLN